MICEKITTIFNSETGRKFCRFQSRSHSFSEMMLLILASYLGKVTNHANLQYVYCENVKLFYFNATERVYWIILFFLYIIKLHTK